MSEVWYRASLGYEPGITALAVVRHTEKTVTYLRFGRPTRENRVGGGRWGSEQKWFNEFEDARGWYLAQLSSKCTRLKSELDEYTEAINRAFKLTAPQVDPASLKERHP